MGKPGLGEFAIRDWGGWYTVEKLGYLGLSKAELVLCSTGSLEHAREYRLKARRAYRHPNTLET